MINKIIVLGGGSAGFLAALALKSKLPMLDVRVIRSSSLGIIGVGEGSTLPVTEFLHRYLGVGFKRFFEVARPTWKLGLKFLWGKRPYFHYTFGNQLDFKLNALPRANGFYCGREMLYEDQHSALMTHDRAFVRLRDDMPAFHDQIAYHFENENLVRFLEGHASSLRIPVIDDTVAEVRQNENGIAGLRLASGAEESADLYVDCSGFVSLLLGHTLNEPFVSFRESLFCDRAVVGGWSRAEEVIKPYTTCETMDSGWCWQIEHEGRINRGYVYSSAFISNEEAEREFRAKNPKVGETRIVPFISGRYQRSWVKNVVAIGNASGFVEPLEASSLGVICLRSQRLTEVLTHCERDVPMSQIQLFNNENAANWDSIRDFLAVHYRYNDRLDTPFWRACRETVQLTGAEGFVDYFKDSGPTPFWKPALFGPFEAFGMAGYLALLVGQQVPYRQTREPSAEEWAAWAAQQDKWKANAEKGLTVTEALKVIRSPKWRWGPGA